MAWTDASNNEARFVIERSTDQKTWAQAGSVGTNATSYTDTGGKKGVVGALLGEVVVVVAPEVWKQRPTTTDLKPGPPEEQGLELLDSCLEIGISRRESLEPRL